MKIALFVMIALSICCARNRHEKPTQQTAQLENLLPVKTFYCDSIVDESIYDARCDELTFQNLEVAFCGRGDMSTHEWPALSGKWHRDEEACYAVGDSKSECSGDGFITMAHRWISKPDKIEIGRALGYLDTTDWVCGDGEKEVTRIPHLDWLLRSTRDYGLRIAAIPEPPNIYDTLVKTHNEYLVALHAYAFGRMNGAISEITLETFRKLRAKHPDSMIFQALFHRYLDGDQQTALDIIDRECPKDTLPVDSGYDGWGSSPRAIHCIVALSILQGI
jgi:hypothetical protein